MTDRLQVNGQLAVNQELVAPNGLTHLIMQGDGNLVLYRNNNSGLYGVEHERQTSHPRDHAGGRQLRLLRCGRPRVLGQRHR